MVGWSGHWSGHIAFGTFLLLSYLSGNAKIAIPQIPFVPGTGNFPVFCGHVGQEWASSGSTSYPAQIFYGAWFPVAWGPLWNLPSSPKNEIILVSSAEFLDLGPLVIFQVGYSNHPREADIPNGTFNHHFE